MKYARTRNTRAQRPNDGILIEITMEDIMEDLLFPASIGRR